MERHEDGLTQSMDDIKMDRPYYGQTEGWKERMKSDRKGWTDGKRDEG